MVHDSQDSLSQTPETLIAFLRSHNTSWILSSSDEEAGINFLRSKDEETYKLLISPVIASTLNQLVCFNDLFPQQFTSFDDQTPPAISIQDYLNRIIKYTPCTPECYFLALIFLDRIIMNCSVRLNSYNIHRFLLVSVLIASKILDDSPYENRYFSHVGGIPIGELNTLERQFLVLVNFNLNIPSRSFECYRHEVEIQILRCEEEPEAEKPVPPPESAELRRTRELNKRLERSRSFNTASTADQILYWRKRRSTSFTVVSVA
eukprot:TRINITY_DN2339_c0_g1_i1.p1 TRINITY_DN2339_c0_g1~~TRINITY_DN2339_c0_g1_i1.p1  ORF type:complete len:262 (+),score=30.34 TRINITY_DN2339_c0_g1_i1:146-931(+)